MAEYHLNHTPDNLQGYYNRDSQPILTIRSGDTIIASVPDADGREIMVERPLEGSPELAGYDRERNPGHCLMGPIAVEGARAGMTLEVHIRELMVGNWGWTSAGWNTEWNRRLNIEDDFHLTLWELDAENQRATHEEGWIVPIHPFLGVIGTTPDEVGNLNTSPPRWCGGNIDCKALEVGSRIYLPVAVDDALLMFGDGHAAQGNGEVTGTAIECGMQRVVLDCMLHENLNLVMPRAKTAAEWITFGFDEDLDVAYFQALSGMLDLMTEIYKMSRLTAYGLASALVDLQITQVVNGVKGVHATLRHGAIQERSA